MEKCRLCLTENSWFTNVSESIEGRPLSLMIMILCPIQIELNDSLPQQICEECLEIMTSAYKLRNESIKNDAYLRHPIDHLVKEEKNENESKCVVKYLNTVKSEKAEEVSPFLLQYELPQSSSSSSVQAHARNQHEIVEYKVKIDLQNEHRRSVVWNYFGTLLTNGAELDTQYYHCSICVASGKNAPKYKKQNSTSAMMNHLRLNHHIDSRNIEKFAVKLTEGLKSNSEFTPKSNREKKGLIARQTALWFCKDLLPFATVNGEGFRDFIRTSDTIKLEDLPNESTLASSVLNDLCADVEHNVKKRLKYAPEVIEIQIDQWTSLNGNIPFITIAIVYLDEKFNLDHLTLTTEKFPRPHTAQRTANFLTSKLELLGLKNKRLILNADYGSNIGDLQKVMPIVAYIDCVAHSINLTLTSDLAKVPEFSEVDKVVKKIKATLGAICYELHDLKNLFLQEQRQEFNEYLNQFEELIEILKADEFIGNHATEFFNRDEEDAIIQEEYAFLSNGQDKFSTFAKPNITRWTSALKMIETYDENRDSINVLLVKVERLDLKLDDEELQRMKEFKSLLSNFQDCVKFLQSESISCVCMVIPFHKSIVEKFEEKIAEDNILKKVYEATLLNFKQRVRVHDEYLVASVLDPAQTHSEYLRSYLRSAGSSRFDIIKTVADKYKIPQNEETTRHQNEANREMNPAKKARIDFLMSQASHVKNSSLVAEFSVFSTKARSFDVMIDISDFWTTNKLELPTLFALARVIFGITPVAARPERNFSVAGSLMIQKRASFTAERSREVLFVHDNYALLKASNTE